MFWFSQAFGLVLMLLKNLSYLFKAFGQSSEMDFFSSHVHQFVFVLYYIIYIYKKEINKLKKKKKAKLHYFWFVQLVLFHQPLFFF